MTPEIKALAERLAEAIRSQVRPLSVVGDLGDCARQAAGCVVLPWVSHDGRVRRNALAGGIRAEVEKHGQSYRWQAWTHDDEADGDAMTERAARDAALAWLRERGMVLL